MDIVDFLCSLSLLASFSLSCLSTFTYGKYRKILIIVEVNIFELNYSIVYIETSMTFMVTPGTQVPEYIGKDSELGELQLHQ
jgi:hypothetical protein